MTVPGPIFIDPFRRIARVEGTLSASIITGPDKVRSGFGNGDCVLLNFRKQVFAVADGTERYPEASSMLLRRLNDIINSSDRPLTSEGWRAMVQRAYGQQPYMYKTTLSLAAVIDGGVFIVNGGDSMTIVVDAGDGSVLYRTVPDMYFAGRSKNIPGAARVDFNGEVRIIIATDGFIDVLKHYTAGIAIESVPGEYLSYPPDRMCGRLYNDLEVNGAAADHDDIGVIFLDPGSLETGDREVLMGGTTAAEERMFQEGRSGRPGKKWFSDNEWHLNGKMFAPSGIFAA